MNWTFGSERRYRGFRCEGFLVQESDFRFKWLFWCKVPKASVLNLKLGKRGMVELRLECRFCI
jgi:hypothetical protein